MLLQRSAPVFGGLIRGAEHRISCRIRACRGQMRRMGRRILRRTPRGPRRSESGAAGGHRRAPMSGPALRPWPPVGGADLLEPGRRRGGGLPPARACSARPLLRRCAACYELTSCGRDITARAVGKNARYCPQSGTASLNSHPPGPIVRVWMPSGSCHRDDRSGWAAPGRPPIGSWGECVSRQYR